MSSWFSLLRTEHFECIYNKKNIRYSLLGPAWKSIQRLIGLNYLPMIHVVRNQTQCILVNQRPRDISLAQLLDLICRVSVCYYIFQRRKHQLGFSDDSSDKSIEFSVSHPSLFSRRCLATRFITDIKWIRNSIGKTRNIRRTTNTIFAGTREAKGEKQFRITGY